DLPLVNPLRSVNGGGPIFRSTDSGVSWVSVSAGINGGGGLLVAGGRSSPLYMTTGGGMFRSSDRGQTWAPAGGPMHDSAAVLAVDPQSPTVLYARPVGGTGVLKSIDAGES